MKKSLVMVVTAGLLGLALGRVQAVNTPDDATITVTPVADITLAFSGGDAYDFGTPDVNTSTVSLSALYLTNAGEVAVYIDKKIQDGDGWTYSNTPGQDNFSLYVATSAAQPATDAFVEAHHLIGAADSALKGTDTNRPFVLPTGQVDLWFRLDLPTKVTNQNPRNIVVRFTGTLS